jgi:hypothetical protein
MIVEQYRAALAALLKAEWVEDYEGWERKTEALSCVITPPTEDDEEPGWAWSIAVRGLDDWVPPGAEGVSIDFMSAKYDVMMTVPDALRRAIGSVMRVDDEESTP